MHVDIFRLYYKESCLPKIKQADKMGCACMRAKSLQLCLTLCDSVDCSLPGSYVHGVIQARIVEWDAMPSSRGSPWPRDQTHISYIYLHWQAGSLTLVPPGKPEMGCTICKFPTLISRTEQCQNLTSLIKWVLITFQISEAQVLGLTQRGAIYFIKNKQRETGPLFLRE